MAKRPAPKPVIKRIKPVPRSKQIKLIMFNGKMPELRLFRQVTSVDLGGEISVSGKSTPHRQEVVSMKQRKKITDLDELDQKDQKLMATSRVWFPENDKRYNMKWNAEVVNCKVVQSQGNEAIDFENLTKHGLVRPGQPIDLDAVRRKVAELEKELESLQ